MEMSNIENDIHICTETGKVSWKGDKDTMYTSNEVYGYIDEMFCKPELLIYEFPLHRVGDIIQPHKDLCDQEVIDHVLTIEKYDELILSCKNWQDVENMMKRIGRLK